MSISLILIPAALAAAATIGATGVVGAMSVSADAGDTGGGGPVPISVQTRMKDADLLSAALADLGATSVSSHDGEITAEIDGLSITMARTEDDVWGAHLTHTDGHEVTEEEATAFIGRLDAAYVGHVQRAVAQRIRARADAAGFELVSETRDEDDTVTMVLNVKDYA